MKTILSYSPKGGAGKSTLVRELAVAAALASPRQTGEEVGGIALADLDPQATLGGWYQRRSSPDPKLVRLDPTNIADGLSAIMQGGAAMLFVDAPPGLPGWMNELAQAADVIVVPVRPTPDDLLAAAPIAATLNATGRPWTFVLTQVPSRSKLAEQAVRVLHGLGRVSLGGMGFRVDYPTAAITGQAAVEFPNTKAAAEVLEIANYVNTLLRNGPGHVKTKG